MSCGIDLAANKNIKYTDLSLEIYCQKYGFKYLYKKTKGNRLIIFFQDKYNFIYFTYVTDLNKQLKATLNNCLNKTELFIKLSKDISQNRFNYDLTKYISNKKSVLIKCNHCETVFERTPNDHLNRHSNCKNCSLENRDNLGFSKSKFIEYCKSDATLYVIKCWDNLEQFYKIGITGKSVVERFRGKFDIPYEYEIIQEIKGNPELIWNIEKYLHRYFKDYKYLPRKSFGGKRECFVL